MSSKKTHLKRSSEVAKCAGLASSSKRKALYRRRGGHIRRLSFGSSTSSRAATSTVSEQKTAWLMRYPASVAPQTASRSEPCSWWWSWFLPELPSWLQLSSAGCGLRDAVQSVHESQKNEYLPIILARPLALTYVKLAAVRYSDICTLKKPCTCQTATQKRATEKQRPQKSD